MSRSSPTWIIVLASIVAVWVVYRFFNIEFGTGETPTVQTYAPKDKSGRDISFDHWKKFNGQSGEFTVSFPVDPIKQESNSTDDETLKPRNSIVYASEQSSDTLYVVTAIKYADEDISVLKNPELLNKTADNILNHKPSSSNTKSKIDFKGHEAVEFQVNAKGSYIQGLTFVAGNTLYILSRASTKQLNPEEYKKFIDSFTPIEQTKK